MPDVIRSCVVDALLYPVSFSMKAHNGHERPVRLYPPGRTERYAIIEISMFEGRNVEAKTALIRLLFGRFAKVPDISPRDAEITIFGTPCITGAFAACLGSGLRPCSRPFWPAY
jgi:hypothetical protein